MRGDSTFCEWLRTAAGQHELVLHGYFHMRPARTGKWWETLITEYYTAGEGEFFEMPEATHSPG